MLEFEQVDRRGVMRVTFSAGWQFVADATTNAALWIAKSWIELWSIMLIVKFLVRNVISHSLGSQLAYNWSFKARDCKVHAG